MTHRLALPLLLLGLVPAACSDDTNGSPDAAADAATDASTVCTEGGVCCTVGVDCPDAAVPDLGPAPDMELKASFCGVLRDEAGALLGGADVLLCNEHTCNTNSSGADGTFCVFVGDAGDYLVHVTEREQGGKHYGEMMFPVTLSAAQDQSAARIELGPIDVPLMGPKVSLDPTAGGTLDLGGGATLTVPAGATVLPPLKTGADVAFRALDKAKLHAELLDDLPAGKSVAAAAVIVPADVTFSSPVSFDLPLSTGLPAGTLLDVHRVHHELGKIEIKGTARVTASDTLADETGKGLTALGVLVFVEQ